MAKLYVDDNCLILSNKKTVFSVNNTWAIRQVGYSLPKCLHLKYTAKHHQFQSSFKNNAN